MEHSRYGTVVVSGHFKMDIGALLSSGLSQIGTSGAEAQIHFWALDAALKRRSSTAFDAGLKACSNCAF